MEILEERAGASLTLTLSGRLDTLAAGALDKKIQTGMEGINDLVFDFAGVGYIASAGLRTLLVAQKCMKQQGSMKLIHVNRDVKDVLELTGFINFLTIEE